jgi:hypothetical protein
MNLSKLSKINEGFERLKVLDKEILAIERLANDIATKSVELELNLKCVKPEDKKEQVLDSDGNLISGDRPYSSSGLFGYMLYSEPKKPATNETTYLEYISDTTALQVLGVLIMQKQEQRNLILKTFEKWGVEL